MSTYVIHPIADLFPKIDGAEFDALVADIKANGLLDPIAIQGNVILDGRNRLRACEVAGVSPRYQEVPPDTDPLHYITSKNVHRRHMTTQQRAAIAAELANLSVGDNRGVTVNQYTKEGEDQMIHPLGTSIEEAAEMMNVSTASVKRAKKTMRDDPEAHEAAKAGKAKAKKAAAKKPRASTVNIYHELGLIPEPKWGGQSQRLNKEVDAIDPGARESGDEARIRAAAVKVAASRKPDAVEEATSSRAEADRQELSQTAQQKLDAAIRSAMRALEAKFEIRVREAVDKELADVLPAYHRDHEKAKSTLRAYKGVLTRSEYKKVLSALHSDRITDEADKRRHDEAFNIIKQHEELLCGFDEGKLSGVIPKTLSELMARRAASRK